jgi:hypothetical protein
MKFRWFFKLKNNIMDKFSLELYGITRTQALQEGICVRCKKPALKNCQTEAGRKEFQISGLCELCFDKLTSEEGAYKNAN